MQQMSSGLQSLPGRLDLHPLPAWKDPCVRTHHQYLYLWHQNKQYFQSGVAAGNFCISQSFLIQHGVFLLRSHIYLCWRAMGNRKEMLAVRLSQHKDHCP